MSPKLFPEEETEDLAIGFPDDGLLGFGAGFDGADRWGLPSNWESNEPKSDLMKEDN